MILWIKSTNTKISDCLLRKNTCIFCSFKLKAICPHNRLSQKCFKTFNIIQHNSPISFYLKNRMHPVVALLYKLLFNNQYSKNIVNIIFRSHYWTRYNSVQFGVLQCSEVQTNYGFSFPYRSFNEQYFLELFSSLIIIRR